jgi:hypothetical protein
MTNRAGSRWPRATPFRAREARGNEFIPFVPRSGTVGLELQYARVIPAPGMVGRRKIPIGNSPRTRISGGDQITAAKQFIAPKVSVRLARHVLLHSPRAF